MRIVLLALVLLTLTDCGIRKQLIAPKDEAAYEEKIRKKREHLEENETPDPAPPTPAAAAVPTAPDGTPLPATVPPAGLR